MNGSNFWGGNDVVRRLAVGVMTEVLLARSAEPNGGSRLAAVKCVARGCVGELLVESLFASYSPGPWRSPARAELAGMLLVELEARLQRDRRGPAC